MGEPLWKMLVGAAIDSTDPAKGPDMAGAYMKGASLAIQQQELKQKRVQLEQQKKENELAKFEKLGGWFETASKMPEGPAKKAFVNEYIPKGISALGLGDKIEPTVMKMLTGDPNLAAYLGSEIRRGNTTLSTLTDPEKVASYTAKAKQFGDLETFRATVEENLPTLQEAEKLAVTEEGKSYRTNRAQQGQTARQNTQISSAGEVESDKATARAHTDFLAGGGLASAEAKLSKLDAVLKQIDKGELKTGTLVGSTLGAGKVMAITDPKLKKASDDIRGAIELKKQLDSQFSANEADQIYSRVFDTGLPTGDNRDKIKALRDQLKADLDNTVGLFRQKGLPVNVKPKISFKSLSTEAQAKVIDRLVKQSGKTSAEVRKELESQ